MNSPFSSFQAIQLFARLRFSLDAGPAEPCICRLQHWLLASYETRCEPLQLKLRQYRSFSCLVLLQSDFNNTRLLQGASPASATRAGQPMKAPRSILALPP